MIIPGVGVGVGDADATTVADGAGEAPGDAEDAVEGAELGVAAAVDVFAGVGDAAEVGPPALAEAVGSAADAVGFALGAIAVGVRLELPSPHAVIAMESANMAPNLKTYLTFIIAR